MDTHTNPKLHSLSVKLTIATLFFAKRNCFIRKWNLVNFDYEYISLENEQSDKTKWWLFANW